MGDWGSRKELEGTKSKKRGWKLFSTSPTGADFSKKFSSHLDVASSVVAVLQIAENVKL